MKHGADAVCHGCTGKGNDQVRFDVTFQTLAPNLKIIAVHGGGFVGAYPGRIDHAWGARSDARGDLPKPPSSYLRKIYVDTVVFTPQQLGALIATFGSDHVLMGTDYPYDMAEYDPLQLISVTASLDDGARAAIAGGNAKKLLAP